MDKNNNHIFNTIKQQSPFLIGYLLFFICCSFIYFLYSKTDIHLFINAHYSTWADTLFRIFTFMGNGYFVVIVTIILLFIKKSWGLITAISSLVAAIIAQFLKHFVFPNHLRPWAYFHDHKLLHIIPGVDLHSFHSFPSGHTTAAFALAFCLAVFFPKKIWQTLFLVYAILVAYSRMYLNQHFFEDVFAGSFIGVATTFFSYVILTRFSFIKKPFWQKPLLKK